MIPPSKIRKARKNLPIIVLILVVACLLFYAGLLTGTKCFGTVCKKNQMHIVRSEKEINKEKENLFKSSKDEEILEHQNNLRFIQRKMFKEELAAPSTPLPSKLAQPKNMEYTSPILKFKSVLNSKEKNLQKSVSHILSSGNVIRQDQKNKFLKDHGWKRNDVPMYIQIRESDSPSIGDFHCGGTEVGNCCAFYVNNVNEAKEICNSYRDYCRGFVLSTLGANAQRQQYLMYLKTRADSMTSNFLTDFFVKSKYMNSIGWRKYEAP